jgi:hypothetical protein
LIVIAEIVGLPAYESQASAFLSDEEQIAMEFFIACAPESHPVIPGTGGFRKARWARGEEERAADFGLFGGDLCEVAKGYAVGERPERARQACGPD